MSTSGGKCVTSATPSSCTPWAPAANRAASADSRFSPGTTRTDSHALGAKRFLHPRPEPLLARLGRLLRFRELPEQCLLVTRHGVRCPELDPYVQVTHA